jgi:perosamine synthetase
MTRSAVPLARPHFGEEEVEAVRAVLASGWVAGQGPKGGELEARWADRCGMQHAVAVSNCTAALHLALLGLGVGPGDDVLVADYTYPATGHSVLFCRARPVFVDVRPDTGALDPEQLELAVTPATRGVIAVDTFGQPAYEAIERFCAQRGLFLIEDAACSIGATYQGKAAGSFGDVACFSLHARKGITSGEGGVLVTDRADIAESARKRSCFGVESAFSRQRGASLPIPVFGELGYNYKLSDILAAIAIVQLDRLDELMARRAAIAARYSTLLGDLPGVTPAVTAEGRTHAWQAYVVTIGEPLDRDRIALDLRSRGVECGIGTYASHLQPVYGTDRSCPVSATLLDRHLALPMYPDLSAEELEQVVSTLYDAVESQLHRIG